MTSSRRLSSSSPHLLESLNSLNSAMTEVADQIAAVRGVVSEVLVLYTALQSLDEALSQAQGVLGAQRQDDQVIDARLAESAPPILAHEPEDSPGLEAAPSGSEAGPVLHVYTTARRGRLDYDLVGEALARCRGILKVRLEDHDSRQAEWTVRLDPAKDPRAARSFLRLAVEGLVAEGDLEEARVESTEWDADSSAA